MPMPEQPPNPPLDAAAESLHALAGAHAVQGPAEAPSTTVLLMNGIPFVHLALCAACCWLPWGWAARALCALSALYLLPALAVRLAMAGGKPAGLLHQHARGFKLWWFATQCQTIFNRLPMLEEILRLVPGLFPLWIRLWGGRMSLQTYVAPGVVILDRWAVEVQRGAVLGYGCLIASHLATREVSGRAVVLVATPCIQAHAIVGGMTKIGPGAVLREGQVLATGRHLGPFATWPRPSTSNANTSNDKSHS